MRFIHSRLLIIATACLTMAAAILWRRGVAYISLDSALDDSAVFYTFLVIPVVLAAFCLGASILPRLVAVNIAVLLGFLTALDLCARLAVAAPLPVHGEPEVNAATSFYVRDVRLGYVVMASATAQHRRTIGETRIYEVTYRTDARGRRETPTNGAGPRTSFLLFFGDSNVFGEGLSQTETLPYLAGEAAPTYRPYNYGVPGYGPSQALILARGGGIRAEIEGESGYAIYFMIAAHVGRVVGSSSVSTSWGRYFPYFVENGQGDLVQLGDFTHSRPLTTLGYFFWSKSALADRFHLELPICYTDGDYRLTARVLKEWSRLLVAQLSLRGAVIVLGQAYDDAQRRTLEGVRVALAREGLSYLDYTRLIDYTDRQYRLAEQDYHSSVAANRIIARRLAADLDHWPPGPKRTGHPLAAVPAR